MNEKHHTKGNIMNDQNERLADAFELINDVLFDLKSMPLERRKQYEACLFNLQSEMLPD